jgi:hypothetical protein
LTFAYGQTGRVMHMFGAQLNTPINYFPNGVPGTAPRVTFGLTIPWGRNPREAFRGAGVFVSVEAFRTTEETDEFHQGASAVGQFEVRPGRGEASIFVGGGYYFGWSHVESAIQAGLSYGLRYVPENVHYHLTETGGHDLHRYLRDFRSEQPRRPRHDE